MTGTSDLFSAWQQQQEAFWSGLTSQAGDAINTGARDWFEQWSKAAGAPAAFAQFSAADVFKSPFLEAFGKNRDLTTFFAFPEGLKASSNQELVEDQVKQLSDYWVGLLHLPTSKFAVEQALGALSAMRVFHEVSRLNPLLSEPMAERWEKIRAGWQTMLQSYKDLLDLYGGYAGRVSVRLVADVDATDREIQSVKELFDLWVRAAEAVHDEITATPEYRQAFGRFVNDLCLTVKLQREATDAFLERMGAPTYAELTDVHARVQRLRKGQRGLRAEVAALAERLAAAQAEIDRLHGSRENVAALLKEQRKLRDEVKRLQKDAGEAAELRNGLTAARREIAELRSEMERLVAVRPAGAQA